MIFAFSPAAAHHGLPPPRIRNATGLSIHHHRRNGRRFAAFAAPTCYIRDIEVSMIGPLISMVNSRLRRALRRGRRISPRLMTLPKSFCFSTLKAPRADNASSHRAKHSCLPHARLPVADDGISHATFAAISGELSFIRGMMRVVSLPLITFFPSRPMAIMLYLFLGRLLFAAACCSHPAIYDTSAPRTTPPHAFHASPATFRQYATLL